MDNLEKFKKYTKIKLIVMSCSTLLPIIILISLPFIQFPNDTVGQDLIPFRFAIAGLTEAWIIWKLVNYGRILASEDYAAKKFITKNDERNKFISLQCNNLVIKISLYILLIILVITAFIDKTAFFSVLAVMGVILVVYGAVRLYFSQKY